MSKLQNLSTFTDLCLSDAAQDATKGGKKAGHGHNHGGHIGCTKGGGGKPSTFALGEEDGCLVFSTKALGEE